MHASDNYIDNPKESGYRGVHLVYRYYSDKKQDYNSLKIEMQLRSQLQHAWATAVETVSVLTQQALKSNIGTDQWKRFFVLASAAIAIRERTTSVPGTPANHRELHQELQHIAGTLNVEDVLRSYVAADQFIGGQ